MIKTRDVFASLLTVGLMTSGAWAGSVFSPSDLSQGTVDTSSTTTTPEVASPLSRPAGAPIAPTPGPINGGSPVAAAPEPSGVALAVSGLGVLTLLARRRSQRPA